MSKEKLFEYYLSKNPALIDQIIDGRVVMSAKGFKKFFETTYDVAYKEGICDAAFRNDPPARKSTDQESQGLKDLLNLFGMR